MINSRRLGFIDVTQKMIEQVDHGDMSACMIFKDLFPIATHHLKAGVITYLCISPRFKKVEVAANIPYYSIEFERLKSGEVVVKSVDVLDA